MYKTFMNSQYNTQQPIQQATYTVTVYANLANAGYVTRSPNKTVYNAGEQLTLTATPYDGYTFTGWSGTSNSTKATIRGSVNGDMTLTANFQYTQKTYTLTTQVFPQDGGYVTCNPDKEKYMAGEEVTVTATHADDYKFINWTGAVSSRTNYVTVRMDGDKTLTANFYRQSVETSSVRQTDDSPTRSASVNEMKEYYIEVSAPMFATPAFGGEWASIEGGWFLLNNLAFGFEFGGGVWGDAHNTYNPLTGVGHRETIGGGFNFGYIGKRWIWGTSLGYWYGRFELEDYETPLQTIYSFGGPYIKLRFWKVCEIGYRGLLGVKQDGTYDAKSSTFISGKGLGLTLASQFKFGLHFDINRSSPQHTTQASMPSYQSGSGTFTDNRDGKTYRTVVIGGKKWMAENLNYKTKKSYCYNGDGDNCDNYGRLYTWNAAMTACPAGWRLPTRQDWNQLGQAVGGNGVTSKVGDIDLVKWDSAGTKLRSTTGWTKVTFNKMIIKTPVNFDLIHGTDDFGFSALPNGLGLHNLFISSYNGVGFLGVWWTDADLKSEYAYSRSVSSGINEMSENVHLKKFEFAVRCVCDE